MGSTDGIKSLKLGAIVGAHVGAEDWAAKIGSAVGNEEGNGVGLNENGEREGKREGSSEWSIVEIAEAEYDGTIDSAESCVSNDGAEVGNVVDSICRRGDGFSEVGLATDGTLDKNTVDEGASECEAVGGTEGTAVGP